MSVDIKNSKVRKFCCRFKIIKYGTNKSTYKLIPINDDISNYPQTPKSALKCIFTKSPGSGKYTVRHGSATPEKHLGVRGRRKSVYVDENCNTPIKKSRMENVSNYKRRLTMTENGMNEMEPANKM